eukprot:7627842-Alexandrium_andersonii.AAC.1
MGQSAELGAQSAASSFQGPWPVLSLGSFEEELLLTREGGDFRYCQAMGSAEFVATQTGYILADGHVPPKCVWRVEFSAVSRSGRRAWKSHKAWQAPPPDDWWVADVQ